MKNNTHVLLFIFVACYSISTYTQQSAITNDSNKGYRFGDAISIFMRAKWVSHKYKIPLLLKPFRHSEQLAVSDNLECFSTQKKYTGTSALARKNYEVNPDAGILYTINFNFRPETMDDIDREMEIDTLIYNTEFIDALRKDISPRQKNNNDDTYKPIQQLDLPNDKITVAVHVRRGGGFDGPRFSDGSSQKPRGQYVDKNFPLRFPMDEYYIEQIKELLNMFPDQELYIHIFTDDREPQKIVEKFETILNNPLLSFGCRVEENKHDINVMDDLFGMVACDCIIRSGSTLSMTAQIIGNHRVAIFPTNHHWENTKLVMDDIKIMIRNEEKTN